MTDTEEEGLELYGGRRTRPHRSAQPALRPDTVGDNLVFDRRRRLAVKKGKHVPSLRPASGNQRDAIPAFDEGSPSSAKNAAQHNVLINTQNDGIAAHNDLVNDVAELRRVVTEMRDSLRAAKLLE